MARSDITLYDSMLSSNLPRNEKSQMRRWFDDASELRSFRPSMPQVHGALTAVRQSTESIATGILLGAVHAECKNGLDVGNIPIDGLLGVVMTAGGALAAESEVAPDARNIGASGLTIWGFRMTTKLLAEKRLASGKALPKHLTYHSTMAGDSDMGLEEDPIIKAAKAL